MINNREIRNSTAEFLISMAEGKESGIQVLYKDETVWATQKAMALLFDCSTDNIGLHLKNIFKSGELNEDSVTEKNSVVQQKGTRSVGRTTTIGASKTSSIVATMTICATEMIICQCFH